MMSPQREGPSSDCANDGVATAGGRNRRRNKNKRQKKRQQQQLQQQQPPQELPQEQQQQNSQDNVKQTPISDPHGDHDTIVHQHDHDHVELPSIISVDNNSLDQLGQSQQTNDNTSKGMNEQPPETALNNFHHGDVEKQIASSSPKTTSSLNIIDQEESTQSSTSPESHLEPEISNVSSPKPTKFDQNSLKNPCQEDSMTPNLLSSEPYSGKDHDDTIGDSLPISDTMEPSAIGQPSIDIDFHQSQPLKVDDNDDDVDKLAQPSSEAQQQQQSELSPAIRGLDSLTCQPKESDIETRNNNDGLMNNTNGINQESEMSMTKNGNVDVGHQTNLDTSQISNNHEAKKIALLTAKLKKYKKLRSQYMTQSSQMESLTEHLKQQANKIKELEGLVLNSKKSCNQLEKLLQHEVACKTRLEYEKTNLNQTVNRLKTQISIYEKNKLTNDELMRTISATLMERETEVSILKLKLTRLQTLNPSSNLSLDNNSTNGTYDPSKAFILAGRSNSEFQRNTPIRSTMISDASVRSSTSQLRSIDNDSSVWASVPQELTPSKRPQLLEKNFQAIYNESRHMQQSATTSTPLARDRRYRTLPPRAVIRSPKENVQNIQPTPNNQPNINGNHCQVTNLDDSTTSGNKSSSTNTSSGVSPDNSMQSGMPAKQPESDIKATANHDEDINELKTRQMVERYTSDMDRSKFKKNGTSESNDKLNHVTQERLPITSNDFNQTPKKSRGPLTLDEGLMRPAPCNSNVLPGPTSHEIDALMLTPTKKSSTFKRMLFKIRSHSRSKTEDHDMEHEPSLVSPFRRDSSRATMAATYGDGRNLMSPKEQKLPFDSDKPFAEWDTNMIVEWLTMIGLSMYAKRCRKWVKCGAHIMNATPAEVDRGLGITNHLHRKKLRLAISELNGDCDKVTKAASKLDYLWVAKWLDDIGLPQYKDAFINGRVDGRMLNYLTVEDLASLDVKNILHHASIRSGIRVLRSIDFDLQLLKRRATPADIEAINNMRQQVSQTNDTNQTMSLKQALNSISPDQNQHSSSGAYPSNAELSLWTCQRLMEWLRLIDFAEFAPNLKGSGVHGGLLVLEDGFNFDLMSSVLSIPPTRTLLRRHLATYFDDLLGRQLINKKKQYLELSTGPKLNTIDEIRNPRKAPLWPLTKLKSSSRVAQDGMDEYLCPMYPIEPTLLKTPTPPAPRQFPGPKNDLTAFQPTQLPKIPESVDV